MQFISYIILKILFFIIDPMKGQKGKIVRWIKCTLSSAWSWGRRRIWGCWCVDDPPSSILHSWESWAYWENSQRIKAILVISCMSYTQALASSWKKNFYHFFFVFTVLFITWLTPTGPGNILSPPLLLLTIYFSSEKKIKFVVPQWLLHVFFMVNFYYYYTCFDRLLLSNQIRVKKEINLLDKFLVIGWLGVFVIFS